MKIPHLFWLLLLLTLGVASAADTNPTPVRVSVDEAVRLALEHNPALRIKRLQPAVVRTQEDIAQAAFDPVLFGGGLRNSQHGPGYALGSGTNAAGLTLDTTTLRAGIAKKTANGTSLELSGQTTVKPAESGDAQSRIGLAVSQPIGAGAGQAANLAILRQARLDTRISVFELRGFALALVAEVERGYWQYAQNLEQLNVYRESLALAERQLDETRERIKVGKLAELEAVAAEAEVAVRREGLIDAENQLALARLRLLRLVNLQQPQPWAVIPELSDKPVVPTAGPGNVEDYVQSAGTGRPDLGQARLAIERGELEVVRTRNGLLPKMNLFVTLGASGYASSFADSVTGQEESGYDLGLGFQAEYPLKNRAAGAGYRRATINRLQAEVALTNLCHLAQEDVRAAWQLAEGARAQEAAARVTQKMQERKFEAERAKFMEGKSTALLVAQAERDLLASRLSTIRAAMAVMTTLTNLYHKDGSLLARRGLLVLEE